MRRPLIYLSLLVCLLLTSKRIVAQTQSLEINGKIVESNDKQPVEFATVMIVDKESQEAVAGTTSDSDGMFRIIAPVPNVFIKISFIGFETLIIRDIPVKNNKAYLGLIELKEVVTTTDEVVIEAEKSQMEFKLDKRVFRVGKDLSSTGASALEVLNNVPSVNVNIEGIISLRGSSGVQILINGKPSVIASQEGNALGTLTADMIDRVEVITNPSAKYDAEGTSGIINIVLKKEEKKGINGSVTVNTGYPNNHSLGLSLNRRTEKFNLFAQLGAGYRTRPGISESLNQNLISNSRIESSGTNEKNENFYNLILGADYHINKYNIITLAGNFAYEIETEFSDADFGIWDDTEAQVAAWNRNESTAATNPKYQYEFQYKKDFRDNKEHQLLFSALGNFFGKDQSSSFGNTPTLGSVPFGDQESRTDFKEARYTFKLDYTQPFNEKFTLESGAQYVINDVGNDYEVRERISGEWLPDLNLTNIFEFNQKVLGAYSTGAYEGDKWGLKLGLRLENTLLNTLLVQTNQSNNQNYTNLFPSVHSSYKFSEFISLQAGYSRRIFRPRLWDLNPFFNVRNNFNIRTGNPELLPEFTDSYELTSIYVFEKFSFNLGVYHRYTTDVVERVSTFEDNINIVKPLNIGTNRATGIEFNAKYTPARWVSINGDFNYLYFKRKGTFDANVFDFSGDQWFGKLSSKFKLPAQFEVEITGHHRSRFQTVQSLISGNVFMDLGMRKKIMKGKGVFNLSVRDVFASRFRESETNQPNFFLYNYSWRGRFITLGFSYGFGKGEAMEFSGEKRRRF